MDRKANGNATQMAVQIFGEYPDLSDRCLSLLVQVNRTSRMDFQVLGIVKFDVNIVGLNYLAVH